MDNLQSSTYETFERDPVKYERYEKVLNVNSWSMVDTSQAIYLALCDRPAVSRM